MVWRGRGWGGGEEGGEEGKRVGRRGAIFSINDSNLQRIDIPHCMEN